MLFCSRCNASFPSDIPRWRCQCGAHLLYRTESMFSIESLAGRPCTLWRYREALGIADAANIVSMGEGFTPLISAEIASRALLLKHDYLCPTGSYKDRGTAVMISKLKEWGVSELIEDSSGNAGASVAAYAALAGIQANIYVPASASAGKIAQIAMYGANLVTTPGSREDTTRAAMAAAETIFYASHNWNPFFVAGLKTAAYEIAEQMNWQAPDWIVSPVGGGNLLVGLYEGFRDLVEHKLIRKAPRLAAVQAANCAPVHAAWSRGMVDTPHIDAKETAAEGIATVRPVRGREILASIRNCNGLVVTVTENEIWKSLQILGKQGVYIEPTAAAAPAAIANLIAAGDVTSDQCVVVIISGSGLKATDKIKQHFELTPATAVVT
jgi:threonine synthase